MDFCGNLAVLEPSMVFQTVNSFNLTGLLKFITYKNMAGFYIHNGEIIHATIASKKKIGLYLLEKKLITRDQLRNAVKVYHHQKDSVHIGDILIEREYIKRESLKVAIQQQMKEIVFEVLTWRKGEFLFFNKVKPVDEDIYLDYKMNYLMLEGLKRLDQKSVHRIKQKVTRKHSESNDSRRRVCRFKHKEKRVPSKIK